MFKPIFLKVLTSPFPGFSQDGYFHVAANAAVAAVAASAMPLHIAQPVLTQNREFPDNFLHEYSFGAVKEQDSTPAMVAHVFSSKL